MTAGKLAALAPAATTASVLYSTDVDTTATTVLQVADRGNSATTYRIGHKDYTQELTMDANTYKFARGNPVSSYKIEIAPGISRGTITPGLEIASSDKAKTAKLFDAVISTATITNYVKVLTTTSVQCNVAGAVGTFQGGETVTGGTSSFSATFRGLGTASMTIEAADIGTGVTNLKFSDGVAAANASYFVLSDGTNNAEVLLSGTPVFYSGTTGGANVPVTRAQWGTSAAAHKPGQYVSLFTEATTTTTINEGAPFAAGDTTLSVTDGTAVVSGALIRVNNEVLQVTNVTGNDLTVTRAQWGTTDAQHADGSTVTPLTQGQQVQVQWFDGAEQLTGGTTNATVDTQFSPTSSAVYITGFAWGTVAGRELDPSGFSMDVDRTYLFDQSDSTNTGLPLRFSDIQEGTGATPTAGTEYTTGVTKTGTAGSNGTIQIVPTSTTPNPLYYYAEGTASTASVTNYSQSITIVQDPLFTEILVYDPKGTWVTGDTFLIGTSTLTVGTVTGGKYGYVAKYSDTKLYVTLGAGSAAFAGSDTFVDTPTAQGADRTTATVSSVTGATDLLTEDYIYYDYALGANGTNEHKGVVIGPNSHLIVYAGSANLSFQVNGFENTVSDYDTVHYNQTDASAAGGQGGAQNPNP